MRTAGYLLETLPVNADLINVPRASSVASGEEYRFGVVRQVHIEDAQARAIVDHSHGLFLIGRVEDANTRRSGAASDVRRDRIYAIRRTTHKRHRPEAANPPAPHVLDLPGRGHRVVLQLGFQRRHRFEIRLTTAGGGCCPLEGFHHLQTRRVVHRDRGDIKPKRLYSFLGVGRRHGLGRHKLARAGVRLVAGPQVVHFRQPARTGVVRRRQRRYRKRKSVPPVHRSDLHHQPIIAGRQLQRRVQTGRKPRSARPTRIAHPPHFLTVQPRLDIIHRQDPHLYARSRLGADSPIQIAGLIPHRRRTDRKLIDVPVAPIVKLHPPPRGGSHPGQLLDFPCNRKIHKLSTGRNHLLLRREDSLKRF